MQRFCFMRYLSNMKRIVFLLFLSAIVIPSVAQNALVQQLAGQMSEDSLITYVKQLTGLLPVHTDEGDKIINNRLSGTAGNELTALFIRQKLSSWGVSYNEVDFSSTGQNIIAEIKGRREGKVMLVGGHYDAVGSNSSEFFYPGADDNASGTAAVLEMARVCAGLQFPVTLQFAFWDEEEQGLVGSRANAPGFMNKLIGYINLDMIAYDSNNDSSFEIHARPAGYSPEMATRTFDLVSLYHVPLVPHLVNPGDPNTDHGSFWDNNLTAIGINEEYSTDFSPHWHKLTDSLVYFNVSYFTRMSRFAATAFLHFAMDTQNLLALNEPSLNDLVDVYPNPFVSEIRFSAPAEYKINRAGLYDATGRLVFIQDVSDKYLRVPQTLNSGLYYLTLYDDRNNVFRKKVMKQQ
jgi:hypothetical protein